MSVKHTFYFGIVELHDFYMIAVINEGLTVDHEINSFLTSLAYSHFKNRPFGYITHRIHSYSVDPSVYSETSKIENLVGFAIVSIKKINLTNAQIEELFLNKPIQTFNEIDNAVAWIKSLIPTN